MVQQYTGYQTLVEFWETALETIVWSSVDNPLELIEFIIEENFGDEYKSFRFDNDKINEYNFNYVR